MSESQEMIGREFAYGGNVSVVKHGNNTIVSIDGSDGSGFKVDQVPFDSWVEINDFVRDAARRLLGPAFTGVTVKDVAIDILESFAEFTKQIENVREYPGMPDFSDYRKQLEDAALAEFQEAIQPIKDSVEERAALVHAALSGAIYGFENPMADRPPGVIGKDTLDRAFSDGMIAGQNLAVRTPESERLLNSFIQCFTAAGMYLWKAHHGIDLDSDDIAEFGHVFHGLFYKFANKERQPKSPPTDDIMVAALRTLIERKKNKNGGTFGGEDLPKVQEAGPSP